VTWLDAPVSLQIEGDGLAHIPIARQLLAKVVMRKEAAGLGMLKGFQRISDHAYAYAISIGGVSVVRIVEDRGREDPESFDVLRFPYPDFISGVATNTVLGKVNNRDVLRAFTPTALAAALFKIGVGSQPVAKLAVLPWVAFDELQEPNGAPYKYTQYTSLKPAMYSGQMRKCVQLLMGFGRQAKKSIYSTSKKFIDDGEDVTDVASAYERQVIEDGRQVRYDYRFMRTHGLTRASDGTWWLVELGISRGIVAMPLPLHDLTTKAKFWDDFLDPLNDEAGKEAVGEFGGFPTGEAFPTDIEPWVRAGKIIRIADTSLLSPFYANSFYSSACGWAFNSNGSECHNTAYSFNDATGIQFGVHWKVNLAINVAAPVVPPHGASTLKARFAFVDDANRDANLYKLDRLTADQIHTIQLELQNGTKAAYHVLDLMLAAPLATGTGTPHQVGKGNLLGKGKRPPYQIKFAEPLLGYLLSHDMRPARPESGPAAPAPVACDTVMYAFFSDDDLKVCKYFAAADRKAITSVDSDGWDEECKYVGTWSRTTKTDVTAPANAFYTNDYDDREEFGASEVVEVITSHDLGFTICAVRRRPDRYPALLHQPHQAICEAVREHQHGRALLPDGDRGAVFRARGLFLCARARAHRQEPRDRQQRGGSGRPELGRRLAPLSRGRRVLRRRSHPRVRQPGQAPRALHLLRAVPLLGLCRRRAVDPEVRRVRVHGLRQPVHRAAEPTGHLHPGHPRGVGIPRVEQLLHERPGMALAGRPDCRAGVFPTLPGPGHRIHAVPGGAAEHLGTVRGHCLQRGAERPAAHRGHA
jgi:hypothetical protein